MGRIPTVGRRWSEAVDDATWPFVGHYQIQTAPVTPNENVIKVAVFFTDGKTVCGGGWPPRGFPSSCGVVFSLRVSNHCLDFPDACLMKRDPT